MGVIILEILVGTELVLAARNEELVEQLLDDCSPYLDGATEHLLRHLILHEGNPSIDDHMRQLVSDGKSAIRASILRIEEAISIDQVLRSWMQDGTELMSSNVEAFYSRYRVYPDDIKRDIEQCRSSDALQLIP